MTTWKTTGGRMLTMLLLSAGILAGAAEAERSFFAPGSDSGKNLPADRIYPQGRIFPYSGFSPANLAELKQGGFTMAGPVYTDRQLRDLCRGAEEHHLGILYPLHPASGAGKLSKSMLDNPAFDAAPFLKDLRRQVRAAADNRNIAWWYLTPEELRPWRKRDMDFLKRAVAVIRKNDPRKRPVWMYLPNHYTAEQMRPFAECLDVVGKGMYPSQFGKERERIWVRQSTEQESGAIRASGKPALALAVPEMFRQPAPDLGKQLNEIVRHDVYLSLMSGARGVAVFSLAKRPGFESHSVYYNAYRTIGRELTEQGLGQAFLFGTKENVLKVIPETKTRLSVSSGPGSKGVRSEYSPVSSLELGYRDERLLFLANSSHGETVPVRIEGFPSGRIRVIDRFTGKETGLVGNGVYKTSLKPYEVQCLRFMPGN